MSFLKSYIYLLLNRVSVGAFGVLIMLLTARLIEPEYYGALVSTIAGMGIIIRFGSLGLVQSFQHFGSKDYSSSQAYIVPLSLAFIVPSLMVFGFSNILVWMSEFFTQLDSKSLFVYNELKVGLVFMMMHLCFSMYFLGSENPKIYLLVSIGPLLITLFCVIYAFFIQKSLDIVLVGWKLQFIIGGLLSFIFIVQESYKQRSYVNQVIDKIIEVTRYGLKSVLVSSITFTLIRISVVIGSAFSLADVAVFAIARTFCEILILAYGALGATLFSAVSRTQASSQALILYCQTARISTVLLIFLSLFIAGIAHKAVPFLFGINYLSSVNIVYILLFGVLLSTQQRLAENFLFGVSAQTEILKYQLPNLILLSSLVWWLTPLYGASGIALASVASSLFAYASVSYLICKKYQIPYKTFVVINDEDLKDIKLKLNHFKKSNLLSRYLK